MNGPVEVHHRVDGRADGPTVVLSNSLATTLEAWDPQMAALAERFRVIRYDLRGHGDSPAGSSPLRIDDLGADLLSLLDRLGVDRAHLCGLSLGGMVSMWVAASAPDRVDRLVLCSSAPRIGTRDRWERRAATVRAAGMDAIAEAVLEIWFTPGYRERVPGVFERMRRMLRSTDPEVYAACCDVLAEADLGPRLDSVAAPTLALAGAEDPSTPPAESAAIAQAVRNGRMEVIDEAAHLINVERPDAVTRAILVHLLATTTREEP